MLACMTRRYLELTAEDRRALVDLGTRLQPYVETLLERVVAAIGEAEELAGVMPPGDISDVLRASLVAYVDALRGDRIEEHLQDSGARIRVRAEEGVSYEGLVVAIMAFEQAVAWAIREAYADGEDLGAVRLAFLRANHRHLTIAANAYIAGKQDTIRAQQQAMLALSTPVVEVWEGVLALPLVGTIDTGRAKQITQSLLRTIRETQARVVIIDISGVPLVDTKVANHLMKTVSAARLLGARGILVGISPEIADTLIGIDVRLDGVDTYFSLRQGLEEALAAQGLNVLPRTAAAR
jgi:rsbT co-antagonist protein RsbR